MKNSPIVVEHVALIEGVKKLYERQKVNLVTW